MVDNDMNEIIEENESPKESFTLTPPKNLDEIMQIICYKKGKKTHL